MSYANRRRSRFFYHPRKRNLMNKKLLSTLIAAALVQGCVEVDDIEQQNELLAEQNEILREANQTGGTQNVQNPIHLTGTVIDSVTELPVASGTVKFKIGHTWSEPVALTTGTFELTNLPIYSDYLLLVESADNAFMPRLISGRTGFGEAGMSVYTDLGTVKVGTPKQYVLKVKDAVTEQHLTGLEFVASSSLANDFVSKPYTHISTEDKNAGTYTITVPNGLVSGVVANLDIDGDDEADYSLQVNEQNYSTSQGKLTYWVDRGGEADNDVMLEPIVEQAVKAPETFDVRFTVVDRNANSIANLEIETEFGQSAVYDDASGQYSLSLEIAQGNQTNIFIPSFETDEHVYVSSTLGIYFRDHDVLLTTSSTNNTNNYLDYEVDTREFDIVMAPRYSASSSVVAEVLYSQQSIAAPNYDYKVFYSKPIELLDSSVVLLEQNKLTVTPGNLSSSDFVPAGTTRFVKKNVPVESEVTLSNNDTLLKFEPTEELSSFTDYVIQFNEIKVKGTDTEFVDSRANASFETLGVSEQVFDINDLIVDNGNFATNGEYIITENTAGETFTTYLRNGRINIILPNSIASLENFTLRLVGKVANGRLTAADDHYEIVENGVVKVSAYDSVALAFNEERVGDVGNVFSGLSVADGKYLMVRNLYHYFDDNTSTDENSVTFEYSYETKEGDIEEGTITLAVK